MNDDIFDSKYRIISELGSGGMSSVYRCVDLTLNREVALKVMQTQHMLDKTSQLRFQREGRAIASLSHENIVTVLGSHVTDGQQPYLIMEIVAGRSLAEVLHQSSPLDYVQTVRIARQIASALAYVHSQKVIHRDLKPANVMVSENNHVKLLDFGIAKILEDQSFKATRTGEAIGTPLYMSPEQSLGKTVDARTDQYSLGCVLFEMLTGRPPYEGDNPVALSLLHAHEPIPSVNKVGAKKIPLKMEAVISKLLSKNPDDRFYDMVEVRDSLDKLYEAANRRTQSLRFPPPVAGVPLLAFVIIASGFLAFLSNQQTASKTSASNDSTPAARSTNIVVRKDDPLRQEEIIADKKLAQYINEHPYATDLKAQFKGSYITDEGIKTLLGHPDLELADFGRCGELTDACAETIARLPIKRLVLGCTNVGDQAVKTLARARNLDFIDLTSTTITNKSCDYFPQFPRLTQLNINNTKIDDDGLKKLAPMPHLVSLNIGDTHVKDIAHSLKLKNLGNFTVNGLTLHRVDFELMATFKDLNTLAIDDCYFDLEDLSLLKDSPIKQLSVHNVSIPAETMAKLKKYWPKAHIDNGQSKIFSAIKDSKPGSNEAKDATDY